MFFTRDNIKIMPRNLDNYITPLTLATLFLSSIGLSKKTTLYKKARLAMSLVSVDDLKYLSFVLKNKYNLETTINFYNNSGSLYIRKSSTYAFTRIIKPHLLPSQYYLLGKPNLKLNLFYRSFNSYILS